VPGAGLETTKKVLNSSGYNFYNRSGVCEKKCNTIPDEILVMTGEMPL
jgi:hypothetical protein